MTPRFAAITASALLYFVSLGMLLPTLPRYVEDDLAGNGLEVGLVVGAFGVSAAIIRPWLGRLGDRHGRRILIVGGIAITGLSVVIYPVWASIPALVMLRVLSGIGEAGAFVGAATATQDLAADDRRGEASNYFSLSVYTGLGIGPFLGEWIDDLSGFRAVTLVCLGLALLGVAFGFAVPLRPPDLGPRPAIDRRGFLHPATIVPGILLTLSLIGFVGYTTFLALYLDDLTNGTASAGPVFLVYSAVVITIRLGFATLTDRLGAKRAATVAFTFISLGLIVVASWGTLAGVYVGTVLLAIGVSFNYPSLFLFVMAGTEPHERSHAVASFGFFFDIAGAIGAPLLGVVIDISGGQRPAFAVGAAAGLIGLFIVNTMQEG